MNDELKVFISGQVYPKVHLLKHGLLRDLKPTERKDHHSCALVCPSCWNHAAFHYFGSGSISCSHCKEQTDLLDALVISTELCKEEAVDLLLSKVALVLPQSLRPKKTTSIGRKGSKKPEPAKVQNIAPWLIPQLKLWLKKHEPATKQLLDCGWTPELIEKAPIGFLPYSKAIPDSWNGECPVHLRESGSRIKEGIVVPWFVSKSDVMLWGYSGSIMSSAPAQLSPVPGMQPCHIHHPLNRRSKWLVVSDDPLLASLLIARGIPACAVGDQGLRAITVGYLSGVNKELYVLGEQTSGLFRDVAAHAPKAKPIKKVVPLALGPYRGAYYRRFTKWPATRFKELDQITFSKPQAIAMLSALLDAELEFDEAVSAIKDKTGYLVSVEQLRD